MRRIFHPPRLHVSGNKRPYWLVKNTSRVITSRFFFWYMLYMLCWCHFFFYSYYWAERHFAAHAPVEFCLVILSARFWGFSTRRSTLFYNTFWREMRENDKYTNISNSVNTRGVCWPLWWGYFNDQSTNETRKSPKTWSLRFDLLKIKMCRWDRKPLRLVLRCWCFTCKNHKVVFEDYREIFDPMKEVNLERDLNLLQLWNKIALSSRWPPSFKSLQITSSFLSLCSHIGHKALKNVPASGLSYFSANSFLGVWGGFSKSWLTTVFGPFALQVCWT